MTENLTVDATIYMEEEAEPVYAMSPAAVAVLDVFSKLMDPSQQWSSMKIQRGHPPMISLYGRFKKETYILPMDAG